MPERAEAVNGNDADGSAAPALESASRIGKARCQIDQASASIRLIFGCASMTGSVMTARQA